MSEKALLNHELLKLKMLKTEFPVRILSVSPRTLSYWQEHELIDKQVHGKQRKFSFLDCIWIQLLNDLQGFKVGTVKIKSIRASSFGSGSVEENSFLLNCLFAIELKLPVYMVINKQGNVMFHIEKSLAKEFNGKHAFEHQLILNLNQIIRSAFLELWDAPLLAKFDILSKEEIQLLKITRSKKYKTIEVVMKDKNESIKMINSTKQIDIEKRFIDIMKEDKWQDISHKMENGKVVSVSQIIKKKL